MKLSTKSIVALTVLALVAGGATTYAQTNENQIPENPRQGGGLPRPPHLEGGKPTTTGTAWRMGSSTGMRGDHMGSSTDMTHVDGFRGIPGVVSEVDADHFLMTSRGLGRGTTTLTVSVSPSTVYLTGSSTASYSSVVVGAKVEVLGKVATSTKTITALRVRIGNGEGQGGDHHIMRGGEGSSTEDVQQGGGNPGFLNKIKNFFKIFGGQGTGGQASGGPAAADGSGDFMGSLMQTLFGWMH